MTLCGDSLTQGLCQLCHDQEQLRSQPLRSAPRLGAALAAFYVAAPAAYSPDSPAPFDNLEWAMAGLEVLATLGMQQQALAAGWERAVVATAALDLEQQAAAAGYMPTHVMEVRKRPLLGIHSSIPDARSTGVWHVDAQTPPAAFAAALLEHAAAILEAAWDDWEEGGRASGGPSRLIPERVDIPGLPSGWWWQAEGLASASMATEHLCSAVASLDRGEPAALRTLSYCQMQRASVPARKVGWVQ